MRARIVQTPAVEVGTPSSIALLAMGFSDRILQTVPLPFDLTRADLTGCSLDVAAAATTLGVGSAGSAGCSLTSPNDAGLLAMTFFRRASRSLALTSS